MTAMKPLAIDLLSQKSLMDPVPTSKNEGEVASGGIGRDFASYAPPMASGAQDGIWRHPLFRGRHDDASNGERETAEMAETREAHLPYHLGVLGGDFSGEER